MIALNARQGLEGRDKRELEFSGRLHGGGILRVVGRTSVKRRLDGVLDGGAENKGRHQQAGGFEDSEEVAWLTRTWAVMEKSPPG